MANISSIIGDLAEAGAVNILVPNLPDIGLAPALTRGSFEAAGAGTFFTETFNAGLASTLDPFLPDPLPNVIQLDIFNLVNSIVASPAAFWLLNVTDPCVDIGNICENPNYFLFWNGIFLLL